MAVGHHSGVLHGAEANRHGNGNLIGLVVRKRNPEVFFESGQNGGRDLGGVLRFRYSTFRNDNPYRHLLRAGFSRINVFEGTDAKCNEVAR